MRIITGSARGIKLTTLEGDDTRPTAERVKEAVFSMIQFELDGRRVLDLFAGSGQMALEALSRGAQKAVMIDINPDAQKIIKANAQKTKLYDRSVVLGGDCKKFIKGFAGKEQFDIIFIDPPYEAKMIPEVLNYLTKFDVIAPNGIVICEDDSSTPYECEGLTLRRHAKYGRIYVTVLEKRMEDETEGE